MYKSGFGNCKKKCKEKCPTKYVRAYWKDEAVIIYVQNALKQLQGKSPEYMIEYVNNPQNNDLDLYLFLGRSSDDYLLASGANPIAEPLSPEKQTKYNRLAFRAINEKLANKCEGFVKYPFASAYIDKVYLKRSYIIKFCKNGVPYFIGAGYPLLEIDCCCQ